MSLPVAWLERGRWPRAGGDLVYLADAAFQVGTALLGDGWTTDPKNDQIEQIAGWIGDRCRDGVLATRLLPELGTQMIEGRPSDWFGRNDGRIVRSGHISRPPRVVGDIIVYTVFIVRTDLESALAPLPNAPEVMTVANLSSYSDHLQFALGLAVKWNATRSWQPPKRSNLTFEIREEWRASRNSDLSSEAAERIGFILKGFTSN